MRNIKKLLSIVMVLTLVLSLGVSAFAATVTINDKLDGHTFTAYQIFKGTQADDSGNRLASVQWGDDIDPAKFVVALKAIDETKFAACSAEDVKTVVKAINENKDLADKIAEAAYAGIKEGAEGKVFSDSTVLDNGYYLIKDTTENLNGNEAYNDVVLQVTEDIEIKYKTDIPESKKKVQDKNDTSAQTDDDKWQDSADWDIGDDVPFQLTGTLPDNYGDYNEYAITFHDVQSDGLTFKADTVEVKVGGETLTKDTDYQVVTPGADGKCTFEIVIPDLKKAAPAATADSEVVVTYKSTLNKNAKIGYEGNPNDMTMEFSNDMHGDGTGTTPNDRVIVFTYEFDANKVDPNKHPLEGAGFTLLKKVAEGGESVTLGEVPNQVTYDDVVIVGEIGPEDLVEGKMPTTFAFKGLDDGEYILVESTVPAGYNKANDIEFKIEATHDEDNADPKLLTFTATGEDISVSESGTTVSGKVTIDVENQTGLELPETGGIGTTIFYVVGAILVAGAVILLVTKKRASDASK